MPFWIALHKRSCRADSVGRSDDRKIRHSSRKGDQKNYSRGYSGICKILAYSAKELLYYHYSNNASENRLPYRNSIRQIKAQKHTRNDRRKIVDGNGTLTKLLKQKLASNTGKHADRYHQKRSQSENDDRRDKRRHKRDNNVKHYRLRVPISPEMRRGGN